MKILCKTQQAVLPASQQVNRIGRYLYKNMDGAFKSTTSSNTADVYFTLLAELPKFEGKSMKRVYQDVLELTVNLNITTYQNKIRVNIIEVTPQERTLGYDLYEPDKTMDLWKTKQRILKNVVRRVEKAYEDYEVVF